MTSLKIKAQYHCDYCNRMYINKISFDKHVLLCDILSSSSNERKREDSENVPSVRELYGIIKTLVVKCDSLETKIEKMQSWVNNNKKKLNVIDWLNTNNSLSVNFNDWVNSLIINSSDMELIFKYNFCEGMRFVIQRIITQGDDNIPLKAFEQRDNILFIYTTEWIIMASDQFELLFKKITKGLIMQFKIWQDQHKHRLCDSDFTDVYTENAKKIFGGDLSIEQQYTKIKRMLYNHIKINIKNMIQYDFEF